MSRLIVVSNRVAPIQSGSSGSVGGLAIAMQDALRERGGVWFGWSGRTTLATADGPEVVEVGKVTYATVDLNQQDYDDARLRISLTAGNACSHCDTGIITTPVQPSA